MNGYRAPVERMLLALQAAGLDDVLGLADFAAIDRDTVADVLGAFGALAGEVIAPTNRIGDTEGARLVDGTVVVPDELAAAFGEFSRGGWVALAAPERFGGGGFPKAVATATQEMFCAANMALSLNPVLTQSAIEALSEWGTDRQRDLYLTRIVAGAWTGTMNLTEPDAGSDVGAVRTTAAPLPDGRYAISGTKIFITWGDHELSSNIVHLVLARLPGAPTGTKGLSLFIVPKYVVADDGTLGERNAVRVLSLEHKLGIHASPTCVLEFDGAIGELVGPEHNGMAAMFSMMNPARLAIGVQGVAVGERAFQQAVAHATERHQGRSPVATGPGQSPIVEHPDVQRMLARIAVGVDAARLVTFATAVAADVAGHHPDEATRDAAQLRADLLTPLAKAWPTDLGNELVSLALQVHGGMGYVEETGIAQLYRDVRIAAIYEGTNGIQAIDLVGRKLARDRGAAMRALLAEIDATLTAAGSTTPERPPPDPTSTNESGATHASAAPGGATPTGASSTRATPTDATSTRATSTDATPADATATRTSTDATPASASPGGATPTGASSTRATPTDAAPGASLVGMAAGVATLRAAHTALADATEWIVTRPAEHRADVLAAAAAYLELAAVVTAGDLLLRQTMLIGAGSDADAARREQARLALFTATYVERARSLAPITIGAATYTSALGMIMW